MLDTYFAIQQVHGLRVVAVTTEDSAPLRLLKPLAAKVAFPMARAMRGPYHVMTGVPTNYVIDRRGILRYAKAGAFDLDALNELLVTQPSISVIERLKKAKSPAVMPVGFGARAATH